MAQGQKTFYMVLGGVVLVGGALIAVKYSGGKPVSIAANPVILPADTSGFRGYFLGSESAPVEVTEYADLECPVCQVFATMQFPDIEKRLIQTGKIRFRFRDFPLDERHAHPREASHAAACANDQGKFWEMVHGIYARQSEWSPKANPIPTFKDIAKSVGIDAGKWSDCMSAGTYAGRIQASLNEGMALGVGSTPSFLIGGRVFEGMNSDNMVRIVDSIIASQAPAKP